MSSRWNKFTIEEKLMIELGLSKIRVNSPSEHEITKTKLMKELEESY